MPNPWFRLYSEFADDPKVQILSEPLQRRLIMLLCSRCKDETLTDEERAFKWHIPVGDVEETKATFLQKGFIDSDWNVLNWNKRQFLSDSSTDRVRKHRAKKADETHETKCNILGTVTQVQSQPTQMPLGTAGNVTVTPPDTDTEAEADSEAEKARTITAPQASPTKRATRIPPDFSVTEEHRKFARKNNLPNPDSQIEAFRDHFVAKAGKEASKLDWDSTFRNWLRTAGRWSPAKAANVTSPDRYRQVSLL